MRAAACRQAAGTAPRDAAAPALRAHLLAHPGRPAPRHLPRLQPGGHGGALGAAAQQLIHQGLQQHGGGGGHARGQLLGSCSTRVGIIILLPRLLLLLLLLLLVLLRLRLLLLLLRLLQLPLPRLPSPLLLLTLLQLARQHSAQRLRLRRAPQVHRQPAARARRRHPTPAARATSAAAAAAATAWRGACGACAGSAGAVLRLAALPALQEGGHLALHGTLADLQAQQLVAAALGCQALPDLRPADRAPDDHLGLDPGSPSIPAGQGGRSRPSGLTQQTGSAEQAGCSARRVPAHPAPPRPTPPA